MDEVVGANLRRLREAEGLTLAQTAMTISYFTDSFSEAKLSRWERGKYHFTLEDLHFMSLTFGVGILGLLTPAKDVTHVTAMGVKQTVQEYQYNFFIDPRGAFLPGMEEIAKRSNQYLTIKAALQDVEGRLGDKGRFGDLYSDMKQDFERHHSDEDYKERYGDGVNPEEHE